MTRGRRLGAEMAGVGVLEVGVRAYAVVAWMGSGM